MRRVVVYSKDGCHLCEKVISELEKMRQVENFDLTTRDITEDSELYERYKHLIPLVSVDGTLKLAGSALSNPAVLRRRLERAIMGE
jgi:glutaredoxin